MTETGSGVVYDGVAARRRRGPDRRVDGEIPVRGPDAAARLPRRHATPRTPTAGSPPATSARSDDDGALARPRPRGDLIITGGENVWPDAVEAVLARSVRGRGRRRRPRRPRVGPAGRRRRRAGRPAAPPTFDELRDDVKDHLGPGPRPASSCSPSPCPARRSEGPPRRACDRHVGRVTAAVKPFPRAGLRPCSSL